MDPTTQRLLMATESLQGGTYKFIPERANTTLSERYIAVVKDSNSNVYALGSSPYSALRPTLESTAFYNSQEPLIKLLLSKFSPNGDLLWTKTVNTTSSVRYLIPRDMVIDSSNKITCVAHITTSSNTTTTRPYMVQFDTDGNVNWQKIFFGLNNPEGSCLGLDSSNNIVLCTGISTMHTQKFSSAGVFDSKFSLTLSSAPVSMVTDSSDNHYLAIGGGVTKFNYSGGGTHLWNRSLTWTPDGEFQGAEITDVCLNSDQDKVYTIGWGSSWYLDLEYEENPNQGFLFVHSSTGTLVADRVIGNEEQGPQYRPIKLVADSSNNIYVIGLNKMDPLIPSATNVSRNWVMQITSTNTSVLRTTNVGSPSYMDIGDCIRSSDGSYILVGSDGDLPENYGYSLDPHWRNGRLNIISFTTSTIIYQGRNTRSTSTYSSLLGATDSAKTSDSNPGITSPIGSSTLAEGTISVGYENAAAHPVTGVFYRY